MINSMKRAIGETERQIARDRLAELRKRVFGVALASE